MLICFWKFRPFSYSANPLSAPHHRFAKEFLKIKDPKDADLKKCERTIAKVLEDYCDINGKSLVLEIARKLCKNNSLRDIVSWTFSINEVYEDNMYDWMY